MTSDEEPSDEALRARLAAAHGDDAAPPFGALVGRRRRRPKPLVLVPLAALAALLMVWRLRPAAPPPVAVAAIELHDPLAFLLEPPGPDVIDGLPALGAHFDEGELP